MSKDKGKIDLGDAVGTAFDIGSKLLLPGPVGGLVGGLAKELIEEVTDDKGGKDDKRAHPGNRRVNRRRRAK